MYEVLVCTEGKCTDRGAKEVLRQFEELVSAHNLTEQVAVKSSNCLGLCKNSGVSVQIGGNLYTGIVPENVAHVFEEYILHIFG